MTQVRCSHGQWWQRTVANRGLCRRFAPTLKTTPAQHVTSSTDEIFAVWPVTKPDDWCGDGASMRTASREIPGDTDVE